jgi:hypothetical protein
MSKIEKEAMRRICELEGQIGLCRDKLTYEKKTDKGTTVTAFRSYSDAVLVQRMERERATWLAVLRNRIRVAADNAWTDDL